MSAKSAKILWSVVKNFKWLWHPLNFDFLLQNIFSFTKFDTIKHKCQLIRAPDWGSLQIRTCLSGKGVEPGQAPIPPSHPHSDLKCQITFGNGFWVLNGGSRSIVLNFYQKKLVFALKNYPRPQRPKRPMKAKKGQQSLKLQHSLISSIFNVKSSINVSVILKKDVFKKFEISIFIT